MGLLDDAIRDHLELKRRHGADPGEVARLEHEALGPARREPAAAASSVAEEEPPYAIPDDDYDDEVPAEERLDAPMHHAEPEPAPAAAAPPASLDEDDADDADLEDEIGSQPTQQFSLSELDAASEEEEAPAERATGAEGEGDPNSEDVLEETPEFLQETPEHDRLWFEQKPPRDFDF
jgi:hypothetical protein